MKLKGVNPIEQHIEKIVLLIMLLLLLAVLAIQFVSRPNNVEVGGGRTVSPDQIYTVLEGEANRLDGQMKSQNPALPELDEVDLVARYNNAFEQSSSSVTQLSSALSTGTKIFESSEQIDSIVVASTDVSALAVPQTSQPVAVSQWATLDPYAVQQVPEYGQYIPSVQPFDFPSVSIESMFSGKELESILLGSDDASTMIPKRFWSASGITVLEFEVERQQLMHDGSWGAPESIQRPPHTPMPTQAVNAESGLFELTDVVTKASGVVNEIARPHFPPTIAGTQWTPPSERVINENESEAATIARLKRLLDRNRQELDRLRGGSGTDPRTTRNTRSRDDRNSRPSPQQDNSDRIKRVEDRIKELEDDLKNLGVEVEEPGSRRARTSADDVKSILEEESISLWAHDLGVEPGATYRYRTRVLVNNPLFRKGGELNADDESQQELTLNPFAHGEWSDWSKEVVVGAREYFFVTKADTTSAIGTGESKSTIELYTMYYGHYRRSTLSVAPGDELASSVRMSGDLLDIDTSVINAKDAGEAFEDLLSEDNTEPLPEGITELSNRIEIDLGAFVLDIFSAQQAVQNEFGQEVVPMHVVFRDRSGEVIVRSDFDDKGSAAFVLASESASEASKSALREPGQPAISPAAELFKPKEP